MKQLAPALLLCALCSDPSAAFSDPLAACENHEEVATGTLCVVKASKTDPLIKDAGQDIYGYGPHVVGIPKTNSPKGIWVHLTGTGGRPYYGKSGRFTNKVWDTELMGQGYIVIDLAYDNAVSLAESCNLDGPGAEMNNCAGDIAAEVITGVDTTPLRNGDVPNSITFRTRALLDYMADNGFLLPNSYKKWQGDWSLLSVSGHSQGAGHAYYIAKYFGSQFGCFLGGPYDPPDNVPEPRPQGERIADWFLDPNTNKTPVKHLGAFVTTADDYYQAFTGAYGHMGLTKGQEWFEANKRRYTNAAGEPIDGHAASVGDPSLASLRAKACFR
jgi:hypothetical protein